MEAIKNRRTQVRYGMLFLVFVNVVINYLDRSNISVAGAMLSKDLNLSSVQLGLIFSAFGWTYALLQIPGGLMPTALARAFYTLCVLSPGRWQRCVRGLCADLLPFFRFGWQRGV